MRNYDSFYDRDIDINVICVKINHYSKHAMSRIEIERLAEHLYGENNYYVPADHIIISVLKEKEDRECNSTK